MAPRTLELQNQIRSTVSGVEYIDTMDLSFAEVIVNSAFLTDPIQVSGTLIMDLNFLRTAVRDIKGASPNFNWFDPSASTAGLITLSGARGALTNIQTFTGADSDHDSTPDYTSTVFISQNSSLETAISALDAALFVVSGTASNTFLKATLIRTGGQVPKDTTIDISSPGSGWTVSGDVITWSSSTDFVDNIAVYHNGILQLNGTNSSADNDVYHVTTPDSLAFEYIIQTNDIIQIWKTPPG